jgi:hypothetical protein
MAAIDISNAQLAEIINSIVVKDTATGRFGLRAKALATNLSNTPVDMNSDFIQILHGLLSQGANGKMVLNYKRITSAGNTPIENHNLTWLEALRKCIYYDTNGQLCIALVEDN